MVSPPARGDWFFISPPLGRGIVCLLRPPGRGRVLCGPPPGGGKREFSWFLLSPGGLLRGESISFSSTGGKDEFLTCLPPGGRKRKNPRNVCVVWVLDTFLLPLGGLFMWSSTGAEEEFYVVLPPGERTEFDVSPPRGEKVFYVVLPQGRGRVLRVSHQGEERKKKTPNLLCGVGSGHFSPPQRKIMPVPPQGTGRVLCGPPTQRGRRFICGPPTRQRKSFTCLPPGGRKREFHGFSSRQRRLVLSLPRWGGESFVFSSHQEDCSEGESISFSSPGGISRFLFLPRGQDEFYMSPTRGRKRRVYSPLCPMGGEHKNAQNVGVVWVPAISWFSSHQRRTLFFISLPCCGGETCSLPCREEQTVYLSPSRQRGLFILSPAAEERRVYLSSLPGGGEHKTPKT